jgi:hypothetical protein
VSGQSCGAWGSLQTAAFRYPNIGDIVAFAPTCHGRRPHAPRLRARRGEEILAIARQLRAPGMLFLYEGDPSTPSTTGPASRRRRFADAFFETQPLIDAVRGRIRAQGALEAPRN